jgi:antitoxin (DNA-binding transcriptional repressor) of toxin-antitoxin stability system
MHDAKTQLSDLVARAEAGEEIVIARRNKPAVRLVRMRTSGEVLPPVEMEPWEHAPDDYIHKDDIAAYYRRFPQEWDDMVGRVGFGEETPAGYDAGGLREAVEQGREYTIMKNGKPVAKVVPVEKKPRVAGRFAHLRGSLPPDLFDQPLTDDELDAWEGKYSDDGGR